MATMVVMAEAMATMVVMAEAMATMVMMAMMAVVMVGAMAMMMTATRHHRRHPHQRWYLLRVQMTHRSPRHSLRHSPHHSPRRNQRRNRLHRSLRPSLPSNQRELLLLLRRSPAHRLSQTWLNQKSKLQPRLQWPQRWQLPEPSLARQRLMKRLPSA
jgi:hypothetical protein